MNVEDIRCEFAEIRGSMKDDSETIEIVGASFEASEPSIFGTVDYTYVERELRWYESMSFNVSDIPGNTPEVWERVSSEEGLVNSNYGFLFFSHGNADQFSHIVDELKRDKGSRRAVAIYTRPTIHYESNFHGMQDFICTNAVQYLIREGQLDVVVQMRSNDVVYGYKNDFAWQRYAQMQVLGALKQTYGNLKLGKIYWQVGSLHMYPKHFHLIDEWVKAHA